MGKIFLRVVLLILVILLVVKAFPLKSANASPQETFGVCVSQVPRDWGQFKGGSQQAGIAFEDGHGTLRFITNFACNGSVPSVALEVKRTGGN